MLGNIATMVSYRRSPRTSFAMKHPVRTVRLLRAKRNMKKAVTSPKIALTVGAAALAIPLGFWIGSRGRAV